MRRGQHFARRCHFDRTWSVREHEPADDMIERQVTRLTDLAPHQRGCRPGSGDPGGSGDRPMHFEGWTPFTQGRDTLLTAFELAGLADRLYLPELTAPLICEPRAVAR